MLKETDILYQDGDYWVAKARSFKGFEIWKDGNTCATLAGRVGFVGGEGMKKCKYLINQKLGK